MTNSASAPVSTTLKKRWVHLRIWEVVTALGILLIAVGVVFVNAHWPYRYRKIKPMLDEAIGGKVTIGHYHRTYFPNPGFMATDVTLVRNPAPGVPPLGTVSSIDLQGSWLDLLMFRKESRQVDITGLHLLIQAGGSAGSKKNSPPGNSSSSGGPDTLVDELRVHESTLDVARAEGGIYTFPIRLLTIRNLHKGRVLSYSVDMSNARPRGHIISEGNFGPIDSRNFGGTPLSGHFTFENVNLHDIGDIGGTLSSEGVFHGNLAHIQADASTVTPDFSVGDGKPTRVTISAHCTINGLSGDVLLDAIDAKFRSTAIHMTGGVVGSPKTIDVDINVPAGRAQDILRPFLHAESPIAGTVRLESHAHVDPAGHGIEFLDRLHMHGFFDIPKERLTDRKTEKEFSAFSQRARKGQPFKAEPPTGSPPADAAQPKDADVVSSLKGKAMIERGNISTRRVEFNIPGCSVDLHGAFNLRDGSAHLLGDLHMQSDVSHATTGFKSFLLKPLIPFFKKRKAGAVIPIEVSGRPGSYKVKQNLVGKK